MTGAQRLPPDIRMVMARCPGCGKFGYPTRRCARRAARILHPDSALSTYQCRDAPAGADRPWHFGHLRRRSRDRATDRVIKRPGERSNEKADERSNERGGG